MKTERGREDRGRERQKKEAELHIKMVSVL